MHGSHVMSENKKHPIDAVNALQGVFLQKVYRYVQYTVR